MSSSKETLESAWCVVGALAVGALMSRLGYRNWGIGIAALGGGYFLIEGTTQVTNFINKFHIKQKKEARAKRKS